MRPRSQLLSCGRRRSRPRPLALGVAGALRNYARPLAVRTRGRRHRRRNWHRPRAPHANAQRAPPRHARFVPPATLQASATPEVADASTPDAEDAADASKAANAALKEAYDHLAAAHREAAQVKDLARLLHAGQHLRVAGVDEPPEMPPPPPSAERVAEAGAAERRGGGARARRVRPALAAQAPAPRPIAGDGPPVPTGSSSTCTA